jgi:hypothetical protein
MEQQGFISMSAAADFLGPGAIEVPIFQNEIMDIVRRNSIALQRLPTLKATGHPHRYFEQTAIATGQFTDPRSISPTPATPTRVERSAYIKAIVNQTNISMFDKDVTEQQGQFAYVVSKDIEDIINGIEVVRAQALWTGTDTSMTSPTTNQYFGFLTQITNTAVIAPGASIIDGLKAIIASMVGSSSFVIKPTAIYVNPILGDYLDREAKAAQITFGKSTVVAGVQVETLRTQAGELPIIGDQFLPSASGSAYGFSAPPAGNLNYFAVILSENLVEVPYISGAEDNPHPRLFQLGLTGNLTGQYVGIKFDTVIAKGASYAHAVVAIQRP